MSDTSAVSNYFATANEGFATTLATTISSGATIVPLNDFTGLTNGSVFVGIIEPGGTKQQTFTGTVDTGGSRITGVVWTRGTNTSHTAGVSIVDYTTGTAFNMLTKGVLTQHNQDGTHAAITATSLSNSGASTLTGPLTLKSYDGWISATNTWVYNSADSGNSTYTFKVTGVDITDRIQAGDKVKLTQTSAKYFIVTKTAFSTDSTITLYGGTDYTLANATITSPFYSHDRSPFGFPLDPNKWTVELRSSADQTKSTPSVSTWYNQGGLSITLPIGSWTFGGKIPLAATTTSTTNNVYGTLSTGTSTESDVDLTAGWTTGSGASTARFMVGVPNKTVTVAAATPYYVNLSTGSGSTTAIVLAGGALSELYIKAVSAYL